MPAFSPCMISPVVQRGSLLKPKYYIDNISGSDANDGLSPESAWKTVAKVNETTFASGDVIGFKNGCTWRETLIAPSDNLTFITYGPGDSAILDGTNFVTGWVNDPSTWKAAADPVYAGQIGAGANINYRNVLPANSYNNGTKIRITVSSHGGAGRIDGMSIGIMTNTSVFDSAPTRVTFGGNNYVDIPANTSVVSDEINFTYDKTKRYGINIYAVQQQYLTYSDNGSRYYELVGTSDKSTQLAFNSSSGIVNGWNYFELLEIYGNNESVYVADFTLDTPHTLYVNGVHKTRKSTIGLLGDNDWHYDSGKISFKSVAGNPDTLGLVIEASALQYVFTTNNKSNIKNSSKLLTKYGDYKRFSDNFLEMPFGAGTTEPTAILSDDGSRMDIWFGGKYTYTTDGITFAALQPILIDGVAYPVGFCHILKDNGIYYLYASYGDKNIHLFTSTDRINFTHVGTVLSITDGAWDRDVVANNFVWKEGSNWLMLYEGGGQFCIGLATATAPEGPWTKYAGNPVIASGVVGTGQPEMMRINSQPIKQGGQYVMYYAGDGWNNIRRAKSSDLHTWVTDGDTFNNRDVHDLPYKTFEDFCLCEFKGKSYMFFAPSSQGGTHHIDICVDNRSHAELLAIAP